MQVTVKVLRRCFVDNRLLDEDTVASVPAEFADLPYFSRETSDDRDDEEQASAPVVKRGRRANAASADK